jgi:hypothetical protein
MVNNATKWPPSLESHNAKDALHEHLARWAKFDAEDHVEPLDPQPIVEYYTIKEIEELGINILEKE